METNKTSLEKQELVMKQSQEISTLNTEVEDLRKEVKQLREDIELIDVFQKKPIVSTEMVQTVGGLLIATLVIIGIFF